MVQGQWPASQTGSQNPFITPIQIFGIFADLSCKENYLLLIDFLILVCILPWNFL